MKSNNNKNFKCGTRVLRCACSHEYQDQKFGREMRVHNLCQGNSARCTVCSKVKSSGG